jgi:Holliday junction resolvase RusA-like endonuclease
MARRRRKPEPACRFTCPIGPSVNNLFVNRSGAVRGGRFRGSDYRRWLQDAGWTVKLQKQPPVPGIVAMLIEAPLHRRRDLDNALKAIIDLTVNLGLIENDNLIDDLHIVRRGTEGDSCTVSIWAL